MNTKTAHAFRSGNPNPAASTGTTSSWRIPAIDGLRAVAAFMIYIFHTWEFSGKPGINLTLGNIHFNVLTPIVDLPAYVDLFMVLSGFCLFLPFCKARGLEKWNTKEYFKRRFRRIVPPYYCGLLYAAFLPVILVALMRILGKEANWQPFPTFWDLAAHALFIHTLFSNTWSSINGSLWTLGLEMHFYLVFPLAIWGYRRWGIRVVGVMFAVSLLYRLVIAPVVLQMGYSSQWLTSIFFLGRWMQFAAGMLAAWTVARYWQRHQHRNASWGLFALVLSAFIYLAANSNLAKELNAYPIRDTLLSIGFGIAIVAFCICAMRLRFLVENKVVVWFGLISYSFYLIHQPTAWYLSEFLRKNAGMDGIMLFAILATAGLCVTTGIAYLFFLGCERPYLNKPAAGKAPVPLMQERTQSDTSEHDLPRDASPEPGRIAVQDQSIA